MSSCIDELIKACRTLEDCTPKLKAPESHVSKTVDLMSREFQELEVSIKEVEGALISISGLSNLLTLLQD